MSPSDRDTLALQLGREPRGTWRVVLRCTHGAPAVIAIAPRLEDGTPFPTTFWLTCPVAVAEMHACESAGEHVEWARRARTDETLAHSLEAADAAYRAARAAEGADADPYGGVGGERDPLRVKCLHARVAARLAGVADPVGEAYAQRCLAVMGGCDGVRCRMSVTGNLTPGLETEGSNQ